jgi:polar amino acid transport system permease protein
VIWPQAILVALRPLANELIGIIKASALAAIVTLLDLMGQTHSSSPAPSISRSISIAR